MLSALLALATVQAPVAPAAPTTPPPAFQRLVDCRKIVDPAQRLACFDREAAVVQGATERRELVVVDRQQIRQTRRTLFGLTLPRLGFLDGEDDDAPEQQQVEGTIRAVSTDRTGKWLVQLEDATWRATEVDEYQATPKVGQKAVVRRGPLGSYIMSIEKRRGVRAVRVR